MSIRNPFIRRWLLYGVVGSLAHFCAVWFFGIIVDEGVVTERLTSLGSWLTLPGGWLSLTFLHNGWLYLSALFANSALWGFTISAVVFYGSRRSSSSPSQHEKAT
jgi:hypothetical protein